MDITIDAISDNCDYNFQYDDYTVTVDNHRILTINTSSEETVAKWLKDVAKTQNTKLSKTILVGLLVDTRTTTYNKKGLVETTYDLLQLCIGSHCLLFHLPDPRARYGYYTPPKSLQKFFSDPRVMAVGFNMKAVAEKLERDFKIKIADAVDINELAVKAMKREDLDLGRYDIDRLVGAVFGKNVYVERPEKKVEWFGRGRGWWYYDGDLCDEKVKYATVDAYLCFIVAFELVNMIYFPLNKNNNKGKKKKKKKVITNY